MFDWFKQYSDQDWIRRVIVSLVAVHRRTPEPNDIVAYHRKDDSEVFAFSVTNGSNDLYCISLFRMGSKHSIKFYVADLTACNGTIASNQVNTR